MVGHERANGARIGKPCKQAGEVLPAQKCGDRGSRDQADEHATTQGLAANVDFRVLVNRLTNLGGCGGTRHLGRIRRSPGAIALPDLGQLLDVQLARCTATCHRLLRKQGVHLHGSLALGLHSHRRGTSSVPCELSVARGCLRFVDQR